MRAPSPHHSGQSRLAVLPYRQAAVQVRQVPAVHEVHLGAAAAAVLPHVRGGAGAAAGGVSVMHKAVHKEWWFMPRCWRCCS